jgi:SAM-dependent methyltransferase
MCFECPICQTRHAQFLPGGVSRPLFSELRIVGGGRRENALCPSCSSSDRERLLYLFLKSQTRIFADRHLLLHVAPEPGLQRKFLQARQLKCVSLDMASPAAAIKANLEQLPFADERFDAIVCNHVLEHVADDGRAMRELLRVLRPGGWAILQVPIARALEQTQEDPRVVTPEAREATFGQFDHVRLYGQDYPNRLRCAGFRVEIVEPCRALGEEAVRRFALQKDENIYVGRKRSRVPFSRLARFAPVGAVSRWFLRKQL